MKALIIFLILFFSGSAVFSQLPACYRHVDQILWVVRDADATVSGWRDLGFEGAVNGNETMMHDQQYIGRPVNIKVLPAYLNLGGVQVTMIQPESSGNAFSDYLEKYGEGAMALMYRLPSLDEMQKERDRIESLGVKVLQSGTFSQGNAEISYIFFDTKKKGKYVLGIFTAPEGSSRFLQTPNTLDLVFNQVAFAIRNPRPVSKFWEKLGFPPLEITHTDTWEKEYYGKPADFDMNLGWQRHGDIVFEWCIPTRPPTVYADFIADHGEGIQHFGMMTKDIDRSISFMQEKGYLIAQSGGWGIKDQPGSGRFAYINLEKLGGITLELLWNYPERQ